MLTDDDYYRAFVARGRMLVGHRRRQHAAASSPAAQPRGSGVAEGGRPPSPLAGGLPVSSAADATGSSRAGEGSSTWPARFHCAFHDVRRSAATRRELRWPRCQTCRGMPLRPFPPTQGAGPPPEVEGAFMEHVECPAMDWAVKLDNPWGIHSWYEGVQYYSSEQ